MRTIALLVICFLSVIDVIAQSSDIPLSDYKINRWTTSQGLTSNNLRDVIQDDKGYIWIASFNGLMKFDGKKFSIYNVDNQSSFVSSSFNFITKDNDGNLWCGTQSGGLIRYSENSFKNVTIDMEISSTIQSAFVDSNKTLWIGTQENGLYSIKDGELQKLPYAILSNSTITSIAELKNDLWFSTEGQGVFRLSNSELTQFLEADGLPDNSINVIKIYQNGIYAGTTRGLAKFTYKWKTVNDLDGIEINDLTFDKYGNCWLATEAGVAIIKTDSTFELLGENKGLPSRQVSGIHIDDEFNVWLSTKKGGLLSLKRSNFINMTSSQGLSSNRVNIISDIGDNTLLIGEDNGEIDIYKSGTFSKIMLDIPLDEISIKDILVDGDSNIWIASYKGVIKKTKQGEKLFSLLNGFPSNQPRCLFEDDQGHIWVGSRKGGIVKFNKDDSFTIYNSDDGFHGEYVFCIDQTPDGRLLAGTYNGNLNTIFPNGDIKSIQIGNDKIEPLIFNITVSNDSITWLATNIGLFKGTGDMYILINKTAGLPVETIFDVIDDGAGYLWLTSNFGVVRVSQASISDFLNDTSNQIDAVLFNEFDGMISRECTGATRALWLSSGQIWIPTLEGITIIKPSQVIKNMVKPQVYIESMVIDDELIHNTNEQISIVHGHRKYSFHFSSLSFSAPDKVRFKYKLEPFDPDWIVNVTSREVSYTNLPYGSYEFKVYGSNNDGVWNDKPATLSFIIEPFFYETTWFVVLVILFFLCFTFLVYWLRVRVIVAKNKELKKLNKEMDGFVYSVSHDLRAPLSSVLGLVNIARLNPDEKSMRSYLDKMETSVLKLDDFIKEIIDYSRNMRLSVTPENCDICQLVDETIASLKYINSDQKIQIATNAPENCFWITDRLRISVILSNILSNALRYAKNYISNPYIKIIIEKNIKQLTIRIADNGIGIRKDSLAKIFDMFYRANDSGEGSGLGLYIVKESVERMGGSIFVYSEFEKGTEFVITLPVLKT